MFAETWITSVYRTILRFVFFLFFLSFGCVFISGVTIPILNLNASFEKTFKSQVKPKCRFGES